MMRENAGGLPQNDNGTGVSVEMNEPVMSFYLPR